MLKTMTYLTNNKIIINHKTIINHIRMLHHEITMNQKMKPNLEIIMNHRIKVTQEVTMNHDYSEVKDEDAGQDERVPGLRGDEMSHTHHNHIKEVRKSGSFRALTHAKAFKLQWRNVLFVDHSPGTPFNVNLLEHQFKN